MAPRKTAKTARKSKKAQALVAPAKTRRSKKAAAPANVTLAELPGFLADYLRDGAGSKARLNRERMVELAEANGCWREGWSSIPNGRARMLVGCALKARLSAGEAFVFPE
jgi:hypothetical protein